MNRDERTSAVERGGYGGDADGFELAEVQNRRLETDSNTTLPNPESAFTSFSLLCLDRTETESRIRGNDFETRMMGVGDGDLGWGGV